MAAPLWTRAHEISSGPNRLGRAWTGRRARFDTADVSECAFYGKGFDIVLLLGLTDHVKDPIRIIRRAAPPESSSSSKPSLPRRSMRVGRLVMRLSV